MEKKENSKEFLKKYPGMKIAIIAFALLLAVGVTSAFTLEKDISIKFGGEEIVVKGKLFDPLQTVLSTNDLPATSDYIYSSELTTLVKDVSSVEIQEKYEGKVLVEDKTVPYATGEKTVGEILTECDIILNPEDKVEPDAQTKVNKNDVEIKVTRVSVVETESQKEVPFTIATVENSSLPKDTKVVVQPGKNGISNVKERIRYENGVEVKRDLIEEKVLAASVEEKTEIGSGAVPPAIVEGVILETASVSPEAPMAVNEPPASTAGSMVVSATAYTHTGNMTATGTWPQAGRTIAGWPEIVGKTVYIPALGGTYTVEDTGGAVGHGVIDIFMDSEAECVQWGRQNIEIYFVD